MQIKTIKSILKRSKPQGWVLEPDAKQLLAAAGLPVPRFDVFQDKAAALAFAVDLGFPVVAKMVSPSIIHKSDVGGVKAGIRNHDELAAVYKQFSQRKGIVGVLVEEMLSGIELIVGGKVDEQFGPVVLLGLGGVGVEVYKDTTLCMAPLSEEDIHNMLAKLRGGQTLLGFRGQEAVNLKALVHLLLEFSKLLMKTSNEVSSMDLNPVICSAQGCVVADARIILQS
jgi:succinyl-CoA synthetase beta subunit